MSSILKRRRSSVRVVIEAIQDAGKGISANQAKSFDPRGIRFVAKIDGARKFLFEIMS